MNDGTVKGTTITCLSVASYEHALTRGRQYEALGENKNGRNVKIRGNNGRTRWYSKHLFDFKGGPAPIVVDWRFDAPIVNEFQDAVNVSFTLDDGTRRWCFFATPAYLAEQLRGHVAEPGIYAAHMVVIRSLTSDDVETMLRHMDAQGELIAASLPIEPYEDDEE